MSWAVLAVAHGIVRENENRRNFHEGRQADGWPHIVAEDEKRRTEGADFGQSQAVDDRRHAVLADAEVEVLASRSVGLEIAGTLELQGGFVR